MGDELFRKRLPVTVKSSDREDRKVNIQVTVERHTSSAPAHRKELVIRLTDESDLFFLYTLRLGEEDFQSLKTQQGLLVDFGAFPQKFIDLLQLVLQEEHKDVPKFILDLVSSGGSGIGCSSALLNVIETNPFKHLTHLALKFLPGTDSDVKKYLADCLKNLKDQNATLLHKLEHTESELSLQLRQAREALSCRTQELDALKSDWTNKISDLSSRHKHETTLEKEKALQYQSETQQRHEREKREMEQSHARVVRQVESKLHELETANKELTDRKYKNESTLRELHSKISGLEEENARLKADVSNLRKDNAGLDTDCHQQEKTVNQLKTRLAVLEQEVKDKEEVMRKTGDLLGTEQDHKRKYVDELEHKKKQIGKLEISVKTITDELVKGNEIIKKLQGEIRNYHTKLKLRTQVTTEQEKLLGEKNREMEEIRKDLESNKTTLRNREDENKKLNESLESTMQKLDESRQLLKTNENVINWLNKQVTESQLNSHRHPVGPFEMNSAPGSSTVPMSRPSHGIHTFGTGSSTAGTSRMTLSSSAMSSASMPTGPGHSFQPHQPRQPHVLYNAGPARKSGLPAPLAKSSPVGTIPEERASLDPQASPTHLSTKPQTQTSNQILDSKYLSRGDEVPVRSNSRPISPTPIQFGGRPPSTIVMTAPPPASTIPARSVAPPPHQMGSVRLSKDFIAPRPSGNQGRPGSQPPLASAYFPNQVKAS